MKLPELTYEQLNALLMTLARGLADLEALNSEERPEPEYQREELLTRRAQEKLVQAWAPEWRRRKAKEKKA